MPAPDWEEAEARLYGATVAAIRRFNDAQGEAESCHFAFDSEPRYGYVFVAFDTTANSLRCAMERHSYAVRKRPQMLEGEDGWRNASYFLTSPRSLPFGDDAGEFAFPEFQKIRFPEWQAFAASPEYPAQEANCDDYLDGHFRVLVWRVTERLIVAGAFDCLLQSRPFTISYAIHDEEQSILRLINWPDAADADGA